MKKKISKVVSLIQLQRLNILVDIEDVKKEDDETDLLTTFNSRIHKKKYYKLCDIFNIAQHDLNTIIYMKFAKIWV